MTSRPRAAPVVVAVDAGTRTGDTFRVAVRPERVQVGGRGSPTPDGGSRLEGTIAELVYLGMYTQLHAETAAGRVVSHVLEGDLQPSFEAGAPVVLWWDAEHAAAIAGEIP